MAAHRWRIGAVRGPMVLGVIVAGVLVIALVIASRWQPPGRPATRPLGPAAAAVPLSLGPTWACPLGAPVPRFADHRSYPPGHPAAPPRTLRPVACYQTTMLATAAGYPPAPPPAGTLEVGGVYLTPPASGCIADASRPRTAWASRFLAPRCCRPCRLVRCRRPPATSGSAARRVLGLCWRRTGSWCRLATSVRLGRRTGGWWPRRPSKRATTSSPARERSSRSRASWCAGSAVASSSAAVLGSLRQRAGALTGAGRGDGGEPAWPHGAAAATGDGGGRAGPGGVAGQRARWRSIVSGPRGLAISGIHTDRLRSASLP
jgi:hypothetical protein